MAYPHGKEDVRHYYSLKLQLESVKCKNKLLLLNEVLRSFFTWPWPRGCFQKDRSMNHDMWEF